jgi:AcrR family transcriptional regulator
VSPRPNIAHLRRPEILAAAGDAIRERGVQRTRVADIAERTGTSAPAVLHYFESKDELVSEALEFAEERFYAELSEALAGLGARERLVRLVELTISEGDYEAVLWIELWPRALRDEGMARTRARQENRWREAIAGAIRGGQASGELTGGDPDDVAVMLSALLDGLSVQVALRDREVPPERARRLCLELLERQLGCTLSGVGEGERSAAA